MGNWRVKVSSAQSLVNVRKPPATKQNKKQAAGITFFFFLKEHESLSYSHME
jgi:hypothetical protein